MGHAQQNKQKLLNRVRRIKGQLNAVEKAIENDEGCSPILLTLAAGRGAINSLVAEIIDGHIRHHIVDPDQRPGTERAEATQELLDVVKAYFK